MHVHERSTGSGWRGVGGEELSKLAAAGKRGGRCNTGCVCTFSPDAAGQVVALLRTAVGAVGTAHHPQRRQHHDAVLTIRTQLVRAQQRRHGGERQRQELRLQGSKCVGKV